MRPVFSAVLGIAGASFAAVSAIGPVSAAPVNVAPPSDWLLTLDGTPIYPKLQEYTVAFTATSAATTIMFGFRQDRGFISFSNVETIDTTAGSGDLLSNGDFSSGILGSNMVSDWTYSNPDGAPFSGKLNVGCGYQGGNCWFDGAVQAYDFLSQTIDTVAGHDYEISFWLNGGTGATYSATSTNGDETDMFGNGANLVVYATAEITPPPAAPEAPTWLMLAAGFGGAGLLSVWRRRRTAAA